jgi:uncharacterized lipoprotein YmbA
MKISMQPPGSKSLFASFSSEKEDPCFFEKKAAKKLFCPFAGAAILALAGCSSPDPTLYTLDPAPGQAVATNFHTIEVRKPGLAGYLDRSDIVLKNSAYKLSTNSQERWGEPLGDMIGRVLTQDLTQRLPGAGVFDQSGAITAYPDARLEVDILTFDPGASGDVTLNASYALESGTGHHPIASRHVTLTAPTTGGAANLAATMSALLGQLADQIARDAAAPAM